MNKHQQELHLRRLITIYQSKSLSDRKRLAWRFIHGYFMLWQVEDVQKIIEEAFEFTAVQAGPNEICDLDKQTVLNFSLFLQMLVEAVSFVGSAGQPSGAPMVAGPEPFSVLHMQKNKKMSHDAINATTDQGQEIEIPSPDHEDYPYYIIAKFFHEYSYDHADAKLKQLLDTAIKNKNKMLSMEETGELVKFCNDLRELLKSGDRVYQEMLEEDEPSENADAGAPLPPPMTSEDKHDTFPTDPSLQQAISLIKYSVHPEKIFLLNPDEKAPDLHYDLLILVSGKYKQPLSYYQYLIEKACEERIQGVLITVSVHKTQDIYPLLKQGHIFYSIACNPDNLVYDTGDLPLPVPGIVPINKITNTVLEEFSLGIRKAGAYLEGARHFILHSDKSIALQLLYQAAQMTLQTVCSHLLGNSSIKTRNLSRLLQSSRRCNARFGQVFPVNNKEEIALLQLLQRVHDFSKTSRQELNVSDLQKLANRVEDLQNIAEKSCMERIQSFHTVIENSAVEITTPTQQGN